MPSTLHNTTVSISLQDCFILDTGSTSGIFAWIGRGSTKQERLQAMRSAEGFLRSNGLPAWTRVQRVVDGAETAMFKQYFSTWKESEGTTKSLQCAHNICDWCGVILGQTLKQSNRKLS